MNFFMEYVKNVVMFMLCLTMILNLYPKSVFEKYIRMFAGLLLLLLIIRPWMKLEEKNFIVTDSLGDLPVEVEEELQEEREQLENKIIERMEGNDEDF
ncbi:MAG: stage III sporulation protein AF [Eubacterium sp.]|nr:stage III sporulation protein AF [Eubacterium sp.]